MAVRSAATAVKALAFALMLPVIWGCGGPERLPTPVAPTEIPDYRLPQPLTPLAKTEISSPSKVSLGKSLFADGRLSADATVACVSCHDLHAGGDDGMPLSRGVAGRTTAVNAPTVLNSGLNFAQFWDGRAQTLEEQIFATVQNSAEMSGDWQTIAATLNQDIALETRFDEVYADGVTPENIVDALAAYVRALVTVDAPFDRYLTGDEGAVDGDVRDGYRLFVSLGCVSCHQGRNVGGNLFQRFGVMGNYFEERGVVSQVDYGRYNVTGRESDRYKFKVPSLRNVADTAPYFHDGSVASLEEAVEIMARYQLGRPATSEQVAKVSAFLRSLSGKLDPWLL